MHYKAPDNSLHCIEPEFAHLLPAGCIAITDEEADALRPVNQIDESAIAKSYLSQTDWYIFRFAETGKEIPKEVLEARKKARLKI